MAGHMISIRYDGDVDALSIRIAAGIIARTIEVDPGTLVDLDSLGNLVAIEVIHPARHWPLDEIIADYAIADPGAVATLRAYWGTYPLEAPAAPNRPAAVATSVGEFTPSTA